MIVKDITEIPTDRKVVLCHGVFDFLHLGHIRHLRAAKSFGDILVVSITDDAHVMKGCNRPIFNEDERAEILDAIEFVDYVIITREDTACKIIRNLKPDVYVKDIEYKFSEDPRFLNEMNEVKKYEGEVRYTSELKYSSTKLINKLIYNDELLKFIDKLHQKYDIDKFYKDLDDIKQLKVLVIGEFILDKYVFGEHLGKMRRETFTDFRARREESYIGGSGIIALHLEDFVKEVCLLTYIGNSEDSLVRQNLKDIKCEFINTSKPVIKKSRYIEENVGYRNIFKISELDDTEYDQNDTAKFINKFKDIAENYDLILICDYGHGIFNSEFVQILNSTNIPKCINVQINSENRGFNVIGKYNNIDYGCINEDELRYYLRDNHSSVEKLSGELFNKLDIKMLSVTRGNKGSTTSCSDKNCHIPAITTSPKDVMGAGDAYFSLSSLFYYLHTYEPDIVGFIGNIGGMLHSMVIGNSKHLKKLEVIKEVEKLLR